MGCVRVPVVYSSLCSSGLLVMEFMEGISGQQVHRVRYPRPRLAQRLQDTIYTMLYMHGLCHGDTHPGNLLFTEDGNLILLDFGITVELSEDEKWGLSSFYYACMRKEWDIAVERFTKYFVTNTVELMKNWSSYASDISEVLQWHFDAHTTRWSTISYFKDVNAVLKKYGAMYTTNFTKVELVFLSCEGFATQIDPEIDIWKNARIFTDRYSPYISANVKRTFDTYFEQVIPSSLAMREAANDYLVAPTHMHRYFFPSAYPLFVKTASRSRIIDVDNNSYVDLSNGYGPHFLGYAHSAITTALCARLNNGFVNALGNDAEVELAQHIVEALAPGGKAILCNSGTEAVLIAVRLCRAYRHRSRVAKLEGHFHGFSDLGMVSSWFRFAGSRHRPQPIAGTEGCDLNWLLAAGAEVKAATRIGGITPLLFASLNGNPAAVKTLLTAGADPNSTKTNGTTALMMAAASGEPEAVNVLLDHGANVNAKEARGQTALMFAAALGHDAVIKLLLARGADASISTPVREAEKVSFDQDGHIFYHPPSKGSETGAKPPALEIKKTDEASAQAAREAAKWELERLSRALGFESARVRLAKPRDAATRRSPPLRVGPEFVGQMTALLYACREGHAKAALALIAGGAEINQMNADKFSPLVIAIINGHLDLAKLLLERGADPNLATLTGLTALYATVDVQWAPHASYPQPNLEQEKTNYLDLMNALLERAAAVNVRLGVKPWFRSMFSDPTWVDLPEATPFWRAAQSSDIVAMRLLVKHGADPKIATKSGVTPLMAAAGVGWASNWSVNAPVPPIEAVKYCVELGLDVNAADNRSYTALHGAAYIGNNEIVQYLVEKGARVDVKSKAGDSPADMANGPWRFGLPHPDTVALLEKLGSPNSHNCRSDKCVVAAKPLSPAEQSAKDALDSFAAALGFQSALFLATAEC